MIGAGAWALLLQLSFATTPVAPAPATPASAAPPVSVVAHVRAGSKLDAACLREAVVGFLAGHHIPATWSTPENAGADPVAARSGRVITVEIDLREAARAALTFVDAAGGVPLLREVALQHGLDDVGCEALADVIESVVLAMAAGPPEPLPEAAAAATSPPATVPVVNLVKANPDAAFGTGHTFGLAYIIQPVAWGVPQSGVELTLMGPPRRYRQRFPLRLAYTFPVTVSAEEAAARWQTLTVAAGLSTSSRGRRVWFEAGFWFGADVTWLERLPVPGGAATTNPTTVDVSLHWASDLTFGVRVSPHAALLASFRVGMANPIILEVDGTRVFETWWAFRPALLIGARWL